MVSPVGLYNDVVNNIMARFPGGQELLENMNQPVFSIEQDNKDEVNRSDRFGPAIEDAVKSMAADASDKGLSNFSDIVKLFRDNSNTDDQDRQAIYNAIASAAEQYQLDPNLIKAVMRTESNFRPDIVSNAGAMGLMQLMPGTASYLGVQEPFDVEQNVNGGAKYLRQMLDLFDGDETLALAAYNAGPGNVQRHGGVPPFAETSSYIPKVQDFRTQYILEQYNAAMNTHN